MAIDRSALRKKMKERQREQQERPEGGGGNSFHSYIKADALKKMGLPWFKKIPEGTLTFDLIPFQVSEKFLINPQTHRADYIPDEYYFVLDLKVHKGIGPNNWDVVCPAAHLGRHCPVCQMAKDAKAKIDGQNKEEWKKKVLPFLPKERNVMLIWIHDKDGVEEEKGPQLLEVSYHSLMKQIKELAVDEDTGETVEYASIEEDGKRISFKRKGTGMQNTQFLGYKFIDRDEALSDDILDHGFFLDEAIEILDEDRIQELVDGMKAAAKDEDDDDDRPRKRRRDEDDEEDEKPRKRRRDEDEDEDEKPKRRSRDENEDDEEEVKPRQRKNPLGRSKSEDDEEEEKPRKHRRDEDEEEEKPRKRKNPCPFGHKFGVDTDETKDCQDCDEDVYNVCLAKKDNA